MQLVRPLALALSLVAAIPTVSGCNPSTGSGSPAAISVATSPASITLSQGQTQAFAASVANDGNIWLIADALNPSRTQDFTYDSLNRIGSFALGGNPYQRFNIDSFGNINQTLNARYTPVYNASNQVTNLPCSAATAPYDASGDQLCDSDPYEAPAQLSYDAENRITFISEVNSPPYEGYTYGADGNRVRKFDALGHYTEYVYFAGQPLAELDQTGAWTDYVYADGRKIAKVPGQDQVMLTSGVADGSNWGWLRWDMNSLPQNPGGGNYTIKAGDELCFRQSGNGVGGPIFQSTYHLILQNLDALKGGVKGLINVYQSITPTGDNSDPNPVQYMQANNPQQAAGMVIAPVVVPMVAAAMMEAAEVGTMASQLSKETGVTRVDLSTPAMRTNLDLVGKPHFDKASGEYINNPHVQERSISVGPSGKVNLGKQTTRPATAADIQAAKKMMKKNQ